ncbi:MAG: crossover junction endodeoxyribonuclease RuvC [Chloroflexi bacterium]|nr:crossover junction endodeoxyribonuclease RuvC [Chloroflexota bacterium]
MPAAADAEIRNSQFAIRNPPGGPLVLGIDPGTAITGYGLVRGEGEALVLVEYGIITTPAGEPLAARLAMLYRRLLELIAQQRPDAVAVEELFFAQNTRTALAVGQARGVVLLAAANAGLPVHEYTPLQVKQSLTGYGRAKKAQVQRMVRWLLHLEQIPQPDDAADALAVAICHLRATPRNVKRET